MSANPRSDQAAKEHFTSLADEMVGAGWTLRDTIPDDYPINVQMVALEDILLELEETVERLWRAMADVIEMPPPLAPFGIDRAA